MPKFSDFLALLTGKPKTLDAAATTLEGAKGQLDSVAALFSAAGLNIDTMLAAGPDALKAHLATLGESSAALATAQTEITNLKTAATGHASTLAAKVTELATMTTDRDAQAAIAATYATAIGLDPKAAPTAAGAKIAFDAHVKKAANLELAKTGHPPIHDAPKLNAAGKFAGPDGKELTGLARTHAAIEAEAAARRAS